MISRVREGCQIGCLTLPSYSALYGESAWSLTREVIGHELRKLHDAPTALPPHLLALAHQLGIIETDASSKAPLRMLVRKLDELEGDQLLRRCNQRLRDLPEMLDVGPLT